MFSFLLFISHIAHLKNKIELNDSVPSKLYDKGDSWYYVSFEEKKNLKLAAKAINRKISDFLPISSSFYSVFLTNNEAKTLQKGFKIWIKKIPAKDKLPIISSKNPLNNLYYVLHSENCKLPGKKILWNPPISTVSFEKHENATLLLSHTKCVRSFEPINSSPVLHTRFNRFVTQTHETKAWDPSNSVYDTYHSSINGNLTGEGQCVLMADSGVDTNNPWLFDEKQTSFNGESVTHRKIKNYYSYADYSDDDAGHGTFLAGLMIGSTNCSKEMELYNGIAPNGKVVVADIGKDGKTQVPKNISILSKLAFQEGCTTQLNAWTLPNQPLMTYAVDKIAYENPNVLTVFPAEGDEYGFIQTPSDAKNVLTVGGVHSKMTSKPLFQKNAAVYIYAAGLDRAIPGIVDEHGTNLFNSSNTNYIKMLIDDKHESVCVMNNSNDLEKCRLILVFGKEELKSSYKIPIVRLPHRWQEPFKVGLEISIVPADIESGKNDEIFSLIPESGRRTVYPGRIKPEIVAPAGPVAGPRSHSNNECSMNSLTGKTGTSVAASFIAADLMILSEHMLSKYKTKLSATLGKALLIASAEDPSKDAEYLKKSNKKVSRVETEGYGFGIPAIENCINKLGHFQDNINIKEERTYTSCFKCNSDGIISCAISWLDLPRDPYSKVKLSTPLSAFITENDQTKWSALGNNEQDGESAIDSSNNNIKIKFEGKKGKSYKLVVISDKFEGVSSVNFSFAIIGDVSSSEGICSPPNSNYCPKECQNGGKCVNRKCVCIGENRGDFCQYSLKSMFMGIPNVITKPVYHSWNYFSMLMPSNWFNGTKLIFHLDKLDETNFDMFVQANDIPSHKDYICTNNNCELGVIDKKKKTFTLPYESWSFLKPREPFFIGIYCKSPFISDRNYSFTPVFEFDE